jgi:uncharacterized phage protein (TIGR02218 family)
VSKTVPASLLTHYALGSTHVSHAIFIERADGETYGFTEHDVSDEVNGFTYVADDPGFSVSNIVIAAGLDVGNSEMEALDFGTVFTKADMLGGKWRNAAFTIFRYNYKQDPIVDIDVCLAGTFGEVEMRRNSLMIEMHDLRRYLNQSVGSARQKTCRYRLGSTSMETGGLCMKDISAPPFTVPFEVTNIVGAGKVTFRDSVLAHAADWFGEGEVQFETGDLAGIKALVRAYDADGTFHLALPLFLPVTVGDTGAAIVGCRKRRTEDCFLKLDNVLNHGGEPDARNVDTLTRKASADG